MGAKYSAADVAAFIVEFSIENTRPVSNLQLQKILFFAQCDYMKSHEKELFNDDFEAWQYGPVVQSVYSAYSIFGGSPISRPAKYRSFNIFLGDSDKVIPLCGAERSSVESTVRRCINMKPWDLVRLSHEKGGAWDSVYNKGGVQGAGYRSIISKKTIMESLK